MNFTSPWLQFDRPRWPKLDAANGANAGSCNVAIVGAGISGVATLYYLMKMTDKRVVLIEQDTVASGASGNNAGMVAGHIEKPVSELVAEFGFDKTKQTFQEIDHGWVLLRELLSEIDEKDNFIPITQGALGLATVENLVHSLRQEKIHESLNRAKWRYLAVNEESVKQCIPDDLQHKVQFVSRQEILSTLRLISGNYVAAAVPGHHFKAGRMNSARLCFKMIAYLTQQYPHRFVIYENTRIDKIVMHDSQVVLHHALGQLEIEEVVVCTNGYKDFLMVDHHGQHNITKLNDAITVREGYLSAYLASKQNPDIFAAGFFDNDGAYEDVPYFYISYAPLPTQLNTQMVMIGGPEYDLPYPCPPTLIEQHALSSYEINKQFITTAVDNTVTHIDYFWRGVMGYTNNGLRWVGQDPEFPGLWYNLGCNGIGLLHAIAGAEKIANRMNGQTYPPALFDPP